MISPTSAVPLAGNCPSTTGVTSTAKALRTSSSSRAATERRSADPGHQRPRPIWTLTTTATTSAASPGHDPVERRHRGRLPVAARDQVEQLHRHPGAEEPPQRPQRHQERPPALESGASDQVVPAAADVVEHLGDGLPRGTPRRPGAPAATLLQPRGRAELVGVGPRVAELVHRAAVGDQLGQVRLEAADQLLALLVGQVGESGADRVDEAGDLRPGLELLVSFIGSPPGWR